MKKETVGILLAFLAVALLLFFFSNEFFQNFDRTEQQARLDAQYMDLSTLCTSKTTCSTCLDSTSCGWCPAAGKCVPKVNGYPVVPRAAATGSAPNAVGDPLFSCPAATFVARKSDCADVQCASYTSCRDCAGAIKCGWCGDSKKCVPKDISGGPAPPTGVTCDRTKFVGAAGSCPVIPCADISGCVDCANATGCGFCKTKNKCVALDMRGNPPADSLCSQADVVVGAYQCPGMQSSSQLSAAERITARNSGEEPSADELAAAQSNGMGGSAGGEPSSTPAPVSGRVGTVVSPVSPATIYTVNTAPGVARPVDGTSERPTFPDASGLGGLEPGPFENYIKMLVKSSLASQGVRTNEPFAEAQGNSRRTAEPFTPDQAIGNATAFMERSQKGILAGPKELRIA